MISSHDEAGARPATAPTRRWRPALLRVLSYVTGAALAATGFCAGIVVGVSAGWLAWLWESGTTGKAMATGALVVLLALLFLGCRAAAYGMESRLGAALPAIGWTVALISLTSYAPGGDIVMSASAINYAFVLGGVLVVVLATATVPPGPGAAPRVAPARVRRR